MKKSFIASILLLHTTLAAWADDAQQKTFTYFDHVLFYDVYAGTVADSIAPVPEGIHRLNNSRYARPIPTEDLAQMGENIRLEVILSPSCDNYDRIANVSLTLMPKGTTYYNDVDSGYLGRLGSTDPNIRRIEIGRFITPFMDKNEEVQEVPYSWDVSFLSPMMHDKALLDSTDIWIELTIEGVPYAANTQIAGCSGRNDVFYGTARLVTDAPSVDAENNHCIVHPLVYQRYVNNYKTGKSDEPGTTTVFYTVEVEEELDDALFVFVNSNHGASTGGEEYNRRIHYVYVNDWMAMVYRPGRTSCEPFRKYNTQGNGIYGGSVKSDEDWQSFSNWCPGDVIDNRIIHLGAVHRGTYTFAMFVPDAVFNGNDGYFPFSLSFFGLKNGVFNGLEQLNEQQRGSLQLHWEGDQVQLLGDNTECVVSWQLLDMEGKTLLSQPGNQVKVNMNQRTTGVYLFLVTLDNGAIETYKFFK